MNNYNFFFFITSNKAVSITLATVLFSFSAFMDKENLLQLYNDIEFMEYFIKVVAADKIETKTANEILRMIREMKDRALK